MLFNSILCDTPEYLKSKLSYRAALEHARAGVSGVDHGDVAQCYNFATYSRAPGPGIGKDDGWSTRWRYR